MYDEVEAAKMLIQLHNLIRERCDEEDYYDWITYYVPDETEIYTELLPLSEVDFARAIRFAGQLILNNQ